MQLVRFWVTEPSQACDAMAMTLHERCLHGCGCRRMRRNRPRLIEVQMLMQQRASQFWRRQSQRRAKEHLVSRYVATLKEGQPSVCELVAELTSIARRWKRCDAVAACSLLLYSEALPGGPTGGSTQGAKLCQALRQRLGREGWEQRRVHAKDMLQRLKDAHEVPPRFYSVLQRTVSVACVHKDGPSSELQSLIAATAAAVCRCDPEGSCPICLARWTPEDSLIVLSCDHVLHVDCFWKVIMSSGAETLRGCCRICTQRSHWGPVARGNFRCMLCSAAAAALVRQCEAGGELTCEELAEYCRRIAKEIGVTYMATLRELAKEIRKKGAKLPVAEMAKLERLVSSAAEVSLDDIS
eukprot:s773_g11.t2